MHLLNDATLVGAGVRPGTGFVERRARLARGDSTRHGDGWAGRLRDMVTLQFHQIRLYNVV